MTPGSDDLSHVHEPVMVQEVLDYLGLLRPTQGAGLLVDGTVGAGGHAKALLAAHAGVQLLGLDRDPAILEHARRRLADYAERVMLIRASYMDLPTLLEERALPAPAGVLLDLGLSSLQLDDMSRGFSFRGEDEIPDMRFDATDDDANTAQYLLNHAPERELARILHEYGEEPRARAVARAIVRARPIQSVRALREVAQRHALRGRRHHPATRTFQALRIAVNEELLHLKYGLERAIDALAVGGRLVVLCFQSGEERLVKDAFREAKRAGKGQILTKKPVRATQEEVRRNPRARPTRLRAFEVTGGADAPREREGS